MKKDEMNPRRATFDLEIAAQVTNRRPLYYRDGAEPLLDRPAHVRAGSALAQMEDHLVVVQDDSLFLALVDRRTHEVIDVPLPAIDGARTFDERRGNKARKLDLEACFADGGLFFALGSGGTRQREHVLLGRGLGGAHPTIHLGHAAELYAALWKEPGFAGAELNIEGAVAHGDEVLLFQRGNGSSPAVDAVAWLPKGPLLAYLAACAAGETAECPPVLRAVTYDLGTVEGTRLTFTDGAVDARGRIAFLAAAEQSPDSYRDGPTVAVALGLIDGLGNARLSLVTDEHGRPFTAKAEGLAFDPDDASRALLVVDCDDPDAPCELCELSIRPR